MTNPLLDDIEELDVMTAIEIALPTRGYFYPEDEVLHPDADPDSISVKPLSVLEETTFSDPLMMISGRAVNRIINRVVPSVIDPARLCEVDIQAILIACRIASRGSMLKLKHTCSSCNHDNPMELNLDEHIQNFNPYSPEEFTQFKLILPVVGQVVNLRPILYEDSINITMDVMKSSLEMGSYEGVSDKDALTEEFIDNYKVQFEKSLDTNLSAIISSIYYIETKSGGHVYDHDMMHEWLMKLPPEDVDAIRDRIKLLNDRIRDMSKIEYQCQSCNETSTLYVELDPQKLFTQAEDSNLVKTSSAKSKTTKNPKKKPSKVSQK